MKITLVRHAEVIQEYQGKYNGHIDIALSENGKIQAKDLAKKLDAEVYDKIYCSDLLRAKQTLELFDYSVKPIYTSKLREKFWGIHEGKSFQEIQESGIKYKNFNQWINALDGECIQMYTKNVHDYFFNTILTSNAKNALIITHSGFIKTLKSLIEDISLEESFQLKLPYCSYITLEINEATF